MLRGYEQRLKNYRNKLISHSDRSSGAPINVTKWFILYSFDFMGDLAFGESFNMLEEGEHWAIKLLSGALDPLAFVFPVWFFPSLTAIPGFTRNRWRFIDFCAKRMDDRLQRKVDIPDIVSALFSGLEGRRPNQAEIQLLRGDAQLIVVARSDTTATTLSTAI